MYLEPESAFYKSRSLPSGPGSGRHKSSSAGNQGGLGMPKPADPMPQRQTIYQPTQGTNIFPIRRNSCSAVPVLKLGLADKPRPQNTPPTRSHDRSGKVGVGSSVRVEASWTARNLAKAAKGKAGRSHFKRSVDIVGPQACLNLLYSCNFS